MDYNEFKEQVAELIGFDLKQYKTQQMDRRINSLKQFWGIETYSEFLDVIKTDPAKYREFVNKLTINVSEFFRNPDRYEELRKTVLPELLSNNTGTLKIWSAGCSDGCEPYSLAIIVKELNADNRVKILATDIDREILEKAKAAVYKPHELKNVSGELLSKYFDIMDDNYHLINSITRMVEFQRHDLFLDPYENDFDMVICRNVVIYFTEPAKQELYEKFYASLKSGGYLLVGGTEPILNYKQYGFTPGPIAFYKKMGK